MFFTCSVWYAEQLIAVAMFSCHQEINYTYVEHNENMRI